MKIQALVAAVALCVAGGAFAQSSYSSKPAGEKAAGAAQEMKSDTKAAAGEVKAEAKDAAAKTKKVAKKTKSKAKHAGHHAAMSGQHMNSTRRMGAMGTGPGTDLEARDRQARMDEAYGNWQRQNKS